MINDYERIRRNIEETWPDWKIQLVNDELLISKHAKKLKTKSERKIEMIFRETNHAKLDSR